MAAWLEELGRPPRIRWPSEAVLRRRLTLALLTLCLVQLHAGLEGPAGFTLFGLFVFFALRAAESWAAVRTRRWERAD